MTKLEVDYYLMFINDRGVLRHPSGLTFKEWVKSLKLIK